jgi:hypothetical protein
MSIIRLIYIKIDPSETETAERIWKSECATLMISQKGCISEKLLRARSRRVHLLFRMGDGGRHRALQEQCRAQADRQPHARCEGRQHGGQII